MEEEVSTNYENEKELIRLMKTVIDEQFPKRKKITESMVQRKINEALNRLSELHNDISKVISSTLSKIDNHLYGKSLKNHM